MESVPPPGAATYSRCNNLKDCYTQRCVVTLLHCLKRCTGEFGDEIVWFHCNFHRFAWCRFRMRGREVIDCGVICAAAKPRWGEGLDPHQSSLFPVICAESTKKFWAYFPFPLTPLTASPPHWSSVRWRDRRSAVSASSEFASIQKCVNRSS